MNALPQPIAAITDAASLEYGPKGLRRCTVVGDDPRLIAMAIGHPLWSTLEELRFESAGGHAADSERAELVTDPSMRELREVRGLRWPELAGICKSSRKLALEVIGFRWSHGEHVVRRLTATESLPQLRKLEVRARGADPTIGRLFTELRRVGRPVESMLVQTDTSLERAADLVFRVEWEAGEVAVRTVVADPSVSAAALAGYVKAFGFPPH